MSAVILEREKVVSMTETTEQRQVMLAKPKTGKLVRPRERFELPGLWQFTSGDLWHLFLKKFRELRVTSGLTGEVFLGHRHYNHPLRDKHVFGVEVESPPKGFALRETLREEHLVEADPLDVLRLALEFPIFWEQRVCIIPTTLTFVDPKEPPKPVFFALVGNEVRYLHRLEPDEDYPWPACTLIGAC